MDYQKFQETIMEQIKEYLPEQYQQSEIDIKAVNKNNNLKLDGLTIRLPEENVTPTIYLNQYYEQHQLGREMEEILSEIAELRGLHDVKENMTVEQFVDFDQVKDKIMFQVIGAKSNEAQLSTMPHRKETDMAIIYRIMVGREEKIATAQISNAMMEQMGTDENTLYAAALENTQREFPMTFASMDEVLLDMMQHDFMGLDLTTLPDGDETKEFLQGLLKEQMEDSAQNDKQLYVLSNESKINGAASLFYPGVQEQIAEQLHGDYFVLPSSIHELLIVPDNGNYSFQELRTMVNEVNETQVAPDEVLTGEVYSYDRESQTLMVAKERFQKLNHHKQEQKPSIMDSLKAKQKEQIPETPDKKGRISDMEL